MVQMADWSNRRCLTNWAWMAVELSGFKPDKRAESYTFAQLENPRVRVFIPLKRLANTVQVAVTIAKEKKKRRRRFYYSCGLKRVIFTAAFF